MHPTVWKASGHIDAFNDPLIDNKDSKKRYRADVLVEEHAAKIEAKIEKEIDKAAARFPARMGSGGKESFNAEMFRATNARVLEYQKQVDEINSRLKSAMENSDWEALRQLIVDLEIADPVSGSRNWTDVRQFNLMFATKMGSTAEGA